MEFIKLNKGSTPVYTHNNISFYKLDTKQEEPDIPPTEVTFDPVFANNSWTKLAEASSIIAANNYNSDDVRTIFGWDLLNDTKDDVGVDGTVRTFHINGFNHDDLSDGTGKAGITLGIKKFELTKYPISSNAANAGGYPQTKMRNETIPTIEMLLSEELQSVIKAVDKKSANGSGSYFTEVVTSSEKLFLYSAVEMFAEEPKYTAQSFSDEGVIYEFWSNKTDADRMSMFGDYYWLRSCRDGRTVFCRVNGSTSGTITSTSNNTSSCRVVYCLCI